MTIIVGLILSLAFIVLGWVLTSPQKTDRDAPPRKARLGTYAGEERRARKRYEPLFYRD